MPDLLLIDVALCVLLIVLAGWVIRGRRRRKRDRAATGAGEWQGTAAEPAGDETAGHEMAVVPGFGYDGAEPDLDAGAPAEPEQVAEPQASAMIVPAPRLGEPPAERDGPRPKRGGPRPKRGGPRPKRGGPVATPYAAPAQPDGSRAEPDEPLVERDAPRVGPDPSPVEPDAPRVERDAPRVEQDAPRVEPNGQPAAASASDRIGSYYDEADRAMSDYLAAMGWTEEPQTRHTG